MGSRRNPAIAGIAAAALGLGIGELVAAFVASSSSPLAVVGAVLIELAPAWAKETMISLFGTADKIVLLLLELAVALALAALAGIVEHRRRFGGAAIALLVGAAGVALALTRADAGDAAWVPASVAAVVTAVALVVIVRRAQGVPEDDDPDEASRRSFLMLTGVTAGIGIVAALGGAIVRGSGRAVSRIREAIRLPAPAAPAAPVPSGADLRVPGLSPLIVPNDDFYRIDTALVVPDVDPADWSLRIHGLVEQEVRITWDELLALPLTERAVTLSCVSNEVGGSLVGNAVWLGYPIRELLARARPKADADMVLSTSADGFTAGTPLEALTDGRDALLAIGMNGQPLPLEHGFPVRMVVPGLYGYVSATKWVVDLEVTRFDQARAYWTNQGWAERGPIKLQSRIDVPRAGRTVAAGESVIAGVAWMPGTGVSGVQVQVDDGPWQDADLGYKISSDTWVQWSLPWRADAGDHSIRCRAVSAAGETQTADVAPVVPDGATGWHVVEVRVE